MTTFTESVVEDAAIGWLAGVGWAVAHGPQTLPGVPAAERADYADVVHTRLLGSALLPKFISGDPPVGNVDGIAGKVVA